MASVINVNFHQTFRPEKQYVAAILELSGDNEAHSVKEISALTGIPNGESSGKVEPHIYYASYMGLLDFEKKEGEYVLSRSSLGNVVFNEDPGLQENLTLLLCHCMMLREQNGAQLWSALFRKVLPQYRNGIKKDMVLKELESPFNGKINAKNIAPFYGSYDSFFDSLGILDDLGDTIKVKSLPFDKECIYVYAYVLLSYWEEFFSEQDEITSVQLDELGFGEAFGWDTQDEYQVLEKLSDMGLIRMNRQLMPYTILRQMDEDNIAGKLYSELC
jgi:hypothetical protein